MGEGGLDRTAPCCLHQGVVTYGVGCVQPLLKVARLDPFAVLAGPDPGIAIGLQFHAYLQSVRLLGIGLLKLAHFIGHAGQRLDVVAKLVRDDIDPREIAACAQLLFHFAVEIGVDVDALVAGAIERPHRALRRAAAGTARLRIEHQLGLAERHVRLREYRLPCLVER